MGLIYLWTWDNELGACVTLTDCFGPYGQLEPNVFLSEYECVKTCGYD